MSVQGEDALEKARRLMTAAVAPNSTAESRRTFRSHLITLASNPSSSYEHKAFFGTLVSKFFGEFEDLQDSTIDALLDLCEDEDEKVRIIGIKGLGPTGRADPRWVKGNTGVLLQLLACQPRELKHVRDSLSMLLTVSPVDVLSVMIDDCRGSEEETGASRKNIIEYLYNDAKEFRKQTLENAKNVEGGVEVQEVFREGFFEVLEKVKGEEEVGMILEMLRDLPSVSGQIATPETKIMFLRVLTRSHFPTGSSPQATATAPLIKMFVEYVDRASPVDPRYAVSFISVHSKFLISLAMGLGSGSGSGKDGNDSSAVLARKALQGLRKWVDGALDQWFRDRDRDRSSSGKDVSEEVVAREFLEVILHNLVTLSRNIIFNNGSLVEIVLYAIYRLATTSDRRSRISSSDARGLSDIAREASRVERQTSIGSTESRIWRNITDMAEILSDTRSRITRITPSWTSTLSRQQPPPPPPSRPSAPVPGPSSSSSSSSAIPPSGPRNNGTARTGSMPGPGPNAPRGPRDRDRDREMPRPPPAGPRVASTSGAGPSSASRPLPTGPRQPSARSSSNQQPHDRERDHGRAEPSSSASRASNGFTRAPRSPPHRRRSMSPAGTRMDGSKRREASPEPPHASKQSPIRPPTPPLPPPTKTKVDDGKPLLPTPLAQGLSIRSASQPTKASAATPIARSITQTSMTSVSGTGVDKTASPAVPTARGTPTSLADRLDASVSDPATAPASTPSPSTKRQREEMPSLPRPTTNNKRESASAQSTERPSLLSRLGVKESNIDSDAPRAKRAKEDLSANASSATSTPVAAKLSLRDRLNGNGKGVLSASPLTTTLKPPTPAVPMNGGASASPPTGPKGLSILNRSTSSPSQNGQRAQSTTPQPKTRGLSILSRSTQSKSPNPPSGPSGNIGTDDKPDVRTDTKRSASLSILRHASTPDVDSDAIHSSSSGAAGRLVRGRDDVPEPEVEEGVIVRKGRGFRAKTPDDIIMADSSTQASANVNGGAGAGLASRMNMGAGTGGGGASIRGRGASRGIGLPFGFAARGRGLVRPDNMGMGRGR
ncbi:hypothetical protein IAT40_002399 [Kwoniella sp. CBS 6097]